MINPVSIKEYRKSQFDVAPTRKPKQSKILKKSIYSDNFQQAPAVKQLYHLTIKADIVDLILQHDYIVEHLLFILQFCSSISYYKVDHRNE